MGPDLDCRAGRPDPRRPGALPRPDRRRGGDRLMAISIPSSRPAAVSVDRVSSKTGKLRRVLVHRPGTELDRLTPSNAAELLFDDVVWPDLARDEHGAL